MASRVASGLVCYIRWCSIGKVNHRNCLTGVLFLYHAATSHQQAPAYLRVSLRRYNNNNNNDDDGGGG